MEIEVLAIEINDEPIELYKLLKIANLVGGGGEAKIVISEGYVHLNGEVETQKRKKVYAEDIVQFNGEAIMPVLSYESIGLDAENTPTEDTFEDLAADTHIESTTDAKVNTSAKDKKANKKASKANASSKKPKSSKTSKSSKAAKQPVKPKTNSRSGRKSISF